MFWALAERKINRYSKKNRRLNRLYESCDTTWRYHTLVTSASATWFLMYQSILSKPSSISTIFFIVGLLVRSGFTQIKPIWMHLFICSQCISSDLDRGSFCSLFLHFLSSCEMYNGKMWDSAKRDSIFKVQLIFLTSSMKSLEDALISYG